LAITGPGLSDDPTKVLIAGREAKRILMDPRTTTFMFVVETPPVDHPLTAEIRVRNRAGYRVAPVRFQYTAPKSSAGTPESSAGATG
jgi:hypothetical protein